MSCECYFFYTIFFVLFVIHRFLFFVSRGETFFGPPFCFRGYFFYIIGNGMGWVGRSVGGFWSGRVGSRSGSISLWSS